MMHRGTVAQAIDTIVKYRAPKPRTFISEKDIVAALGCSASRVREECKYLVANGFMNMTHINNERHYTYDPTHP